MQEQDMPDSGEIENLLAGKEALEGLKEDLAELDPSAGRLSRVDQAALARRITAQVGVLSPLKAAIGAQVSKENAARVQRALERLPRVTRALIYAQTRYNAASTVVTTPPPRAFDVVLTWRDAMLSTMSTLEALGHVSAPQAAHIRAGRGHLDAARDAVELTALFDDKWETVEPLQSLQSDPALRVTREVLATVQEAALRFIEAAEAADAQLPAETQVRGWEQTLRGLTALLEEDWDALRHAAEYAHKNKAIDVDLSQLASAYALSRRG
jgi:hypothetical protein